MGMTIHSGDAFTAPDVFFNHSGRKSWSNLGITELDAEKFLDMLSFCLNDGHSMGWNDAHHGRVESTPWNPFDPAFAEGLPHRAWQLAYAEGVRARQSHGPQHQTAGHQSASPAAAG